MASFHAELVHEDRARPDLEGLPADRREAVLGDLGQLRALCQTMVGLDVPPLGVVATGSQMDKREGDLNRLVGEATREYRNADGTLNPLGNEPEFNFYRRYILGGLSDPDCLCAVGVIAGMASEGKSPFWLRYHQKTSQFQTVADRIMASRFARDARGDGGHIWLPLCVSPDRSGAAVVDELTVQIEEIRSVAAGSDQS